MDNSAQTKTPRKARAINHSGFILKEDMPDGRQIWVHPERMEEIILNPPSTPTPEVLANLAANGIVPQVPTLETYEQTQVVNDPDEDEDDHDTALSRVLARMKSTGDPELRAEVRVYREKSDRTFSYCATFSVEQFDEGGVELIRAGFGAGKYRVRVYGPKQDREGNYGKFVHLTNELIEIEASNIPLRSNLPGLAGASDNPTNQMMQAMQPVLNMMQEMQRQMLEMKQGGGADKMAEMMQMADLLKKIGGNNGGSSKPQSVRDMLAELRELQKFDQSLKPAEKEKDGDEPSLMGLGIELVKTIQGAAAQQPAIQTEQPALPVSPQLNQNDNMNTPEIFMLNVTAGALISAAQRGDDVTKHASGLLDMLPDPAFDMLAAPLWFDALKEMLPLRAVQLDENREWFGKLRDEVLRLDSLADNAPD